MGPASGGTVHLGTFKDEELAWSPCKGQGILNKIVCWSLGIFQI